MHWPWAEIDTDLRSTQVILTLFLTRTWQHRSIRKLPSLLNWIRLKLKTIHILCPYKRQRSMLCFISFKFSGLQVKHVIGKALSLTLPIYYWNICLCWVSTLFDMIWLFSKCNKNSITWFRSGYIMLYLRCKCATFLCARTPRNAIRRSIEFCLL